MIPQIIFIGLTCINLGVILGKHGKPREGNHSIWIQLISEAITLTILYYGGFFDCWK